MVNLLLCSSLFLLDVVYCPRLPCGAAVIWEKSSKAAMCSVCAFAFCVTCRKTYHGADDCQREREIPKQRHEQMDNTQQGNVDLPRSQGTQAYLCVCERAIGKNTGNVHPEQSIMHTAKRVRLTTKTKISYFLKQNANH